jgi:hypothetical protein
MEVTPCPEYTDSTATTTVFPPPWLRLRVMVLPMFLAQTAAVPDAPMLACNREAERSTDNNIFIIILYSPY